MDRTPQPPDQPEDHKLDARGHAWRAQDPGRESDPLPHHPHEEVELGQEVAEPELDGDDLLELGMDDLKNADGPDA